jgi:uncharacterized protein (DUF302 family)
MMKYLVLMMSFLLALASSVSANTQVSGLNIEDATSVQEAVEHITFTLEGQGFEIVTTVNFKLAAASIGVEIRPTTVIIATNPSLETPLIRRRQTVALDFPAKFLVFEDAEGKSYENHCCPRQPKAQTVGAVFMQVLSGKCAIFKFVPHMLSKTGKAHEY